MARDTCDSIQHRRAGSPHWTPRAVGPLRRAAGLQLCLVTAEAAPAAGAPQPTGRARESASRFSRRVPGFVWLGLDQPKAQPAAALLCSFRGAGVRRERPIRARSRRSIVGATQGPQQGFGRPKAPSPAARRDTQPRGARPPCRVGTATSPGTSPPGCPLRVAAPGGWAAPAPMGGPSPLD